MKTRSLITLGISALALTACTGTDEPAPPAETGAGSPTEIVEQPTTEPMGHGTYELHYQGAEITFDLPADPAAEEIQEIEEYRQATGADPVTYITADVDNRDGETLINMHQIEVFDAEGNNYEFNGASQFLNEWSPTFTEDYEYILPNGDELSEEEGSELSSRGTELHNEHLDGVDVAGRGTIVLVYDGDDLPDEFTRVAVQPSGMVDTVDAYPAN